MRMRNSILSLVLISRYFMFVTMIISSLATGEVQGVSRPSNLSEPNESPVTIKISTDRDKLELGEPGHVLVRFRNTSQSDLVLDLDGLSLINPYSGEKLLLNNSDFTEQHTRDLIKYLIIPTNSEISMIYANLILPEGNWGVCFEYQRKDASVECFGDSVCVLNGKILSNIMRMTIGSPGSENVGQLEDLLWSQIDEIPACDWRDLQYNYARQYWVDMSPYSIPILLRNLDHPDIEKRVAILDILEAIATFQGTDAYKQSCDFWKELMKRYEQESDLKMKEILLNVISYCDRLPKEQRETIKFFLKNEMMENEEKLLRRAAALGYLDFDLVEALDVIIEEGLLIDDRLGEEFLPYLENSLAIAGVPQPSFSPATAKQWLTENRSKIVEIQQERERRIESIRDRQTKIKLEWKASLGDN